MKYGRAVQDNTLNGITICEEFIDYIGDREPTPQDFPRFIEFLEEYYPSLCGMGALLWEEDICPEPRQFDFTVRQIDTEVLVKQFAASQSTYSSRTTDSTPGYILFRRWLRENHPEDYPYWASIWAWGVLAHEP